MAYFEEAGSCNVLARGVVSVSPSGWDSIFCASLRGGSLSLLFGGRKSPDEGADDVLAAVGWSSRDPLLPNPRLWVLRGD